MKRLVIVVVIAALLWLFKLSFDVYQMNAKQTELMQQQTQLQQQNAGLNDQLVAMKRQYDGQPVTSSPANPPAMQADDHVGVQPITLIGQRLELVEFALQQQQFGVALEKLNQLDQQLEIFSLAPALRMSLHQVIAKDREMLTQYVVARQTQQNKIKQVLQTLDQALQKEIQQPYQNTPKQKEQSFLSRWIQVEAVERPSVDLLQRGIVLKEIQLRLLLAQQIMLKGQYPEFQQELTEIIQIMQQLPDPHLKQIQQKIVQLKETPVLSVPQLNTRALIG
ncbi:hypothetical protein F7P75_04175 [Acinetobacter gandensis]|uniref:Uncharacterized protein n=1 Tax=Acinetobacter gandensis TaxID=1443941 RepID=A0A1A7RHA1_9GAMM|nr:MULTISPECIES: hypothetical protein [Acinetobacter]KAB0628340.1 hypothetical protein F7P75_04175 [Acinetobacter gandensis]OBX30007.1 hypothetical protein A9J31_00400 [Acinetobacter gandensis]